VPVVANTPPTSSLSDEFVFYFFLAWVPFVAGLTLLCAPIFLVVPVHTQIIILPLGAALLLMAATVTCTALYKYRSSKRSSSPTITPSAGTALPSDLDDQPVQTPSEETELPYNGERSRPSLLAKRQPAITSRLHPDH
jgi:thiol:disulfide interchange protein